MTFVQYLILINQFLKKLKFITFADDTHLFCSRPDIQELTTEEKELTMLKEWFYINMLSLNETK